MEWINHCSLYPGNCYLDGIPIRIISGKVPCSVSQYFGEISTNCQYEKLEDQLFLTRVGNRVAYTTLKEISIEIVCESKDRSIRNLTGRGILTLDSDCELSSPFFTMNQPRQLGTSRILTSEAGVKLDSSSLHLINISDRVEPLRLQRRPNKWTLQGLRSPLKYLLRETVLIITLFVLIIFMIFSCIVLRGCFRSQNAETNV